MAWLKLCLFVLLFVEVQSRGNRKFCPSECHCKENKIDCSRLNFTEIAREVLRYNGTIRCNKLNLEGCGINGEIPKGFLKKFPNLKLLRLSNNHLRKVPDLTNLPNLDTLFLSSNDITKFDSDAFQGPRKLKYLYLDRNGIVAVPSAALYPLKRLQTLNLDSNHIKKVAIRAFHGLLSLRALKLNGNAIKVLKDGCFAGLSSLTTLNLKDNNLSQFPKKVLQDVKQVSTLVLGRNKISSIPPFAFDGFSSLKALDIWNQVHLKTVSHTAFRNMASLSKLKVHCNNGATKLTQFPDLKGTLKLKELDLTYCNLQDMPADFCQNRTHLITLNLLWNKIHTLPKMQACKHLKFLDLKHNRIESLDGALTNVKTLMDLDLSSNHIKRIEKDDFLGLKRVDKLDLSHNLIEDIHPGAFESFHKLEVLSLESNKLKKFPTNGLEALTLINTKGNPDMFDFPSHSKLPKIRALIVHYPYHCCYYRDKELKEEDSVVVRGLSQWKFNWLWDSGNETVSDDDDEWPTDIPDHVEEEDLEPLVNINSTNGDKNDHVSIPVLKDDPIPLKKKVECQPRPNVFYPCDNLMTKQWLRICVWIVFLLALIGNSVVLFVIFANCSKFDVQRFLTLNLAIADLLLGVYLGFLAVVDIMTFGNFRAKALEWQFSPQCKAAGFIAVLSSELSVYTLLVITIERFITIKYSMYINKQMSVTKAVVIMIFGWVFCIALAVMPILQFNTENGVLHFSGYTKYSICLPFDVPDESSISHTPSIVYLSFVLVFNIFAFTMIVFCYVKIFLSVRGSGAFNSGDSRVAKRVALLVFTDFACWFPICILALAAIHGAPLFKDLWLAKVFTVFVFPLNACANPFLYAIFTKQFHKDCSAMYRQMKQSDIRLFDRLNKKLHPSNWKLSPSYQAFRRGSSCSFHIGRRCSTRGDELRMSSRSTYRTPMNTDDERERDREDRCDNRIEEIHERETCL
ncbi:follicle-stimulating hormone receptor-like isoform X2 [Rhopilema esculentum]|uniref:follicle-stimulating hormone receptor-like isoform X2 n=1 Tax=Rhopilema esculentum TaxID=499914 RepID=UPI0031D616C2